MIVPLVGGVDSADYWNGINAFVRNLRLNKYACDNEFNYFRSFFPSSPLCLSALAFRCRNHDELHSARHNRLACMSVPGSDTERGLNELVQCWESTTRNHFWVFPRFRLSVAPRYARSRTWFLFVWLSFATSSPSSKAKVKVRCSLPSSRSARQLEIIWSSGCPFH